MQKLETNLLIKQGIFKKCPSSSISTAITSTGSQVAEFDPHLHSAQLGTSGNYIAKDNNVGGCSENISITIKPAWRMLIVNHLQSVIDRGMHEESRMKESRMENQRKKREAAAAR